jgi:hypothetical protein
MNGQCSAKMEMDEAIQLRYHSLNTEAKTYNINSQTEIWIKAVEFCKMIHNLIANIFNC